MRIKLILCLSIIFFSCGGNRDKFHYETSIAAKVYEAQLKYLDITLNEYGRISKEGDYYLKESKYLDVLSETLKEEIRKGRIISEKAKSDFFEHFEKTFRTHALIDPSILKELKNLPIETISDVDMLRAYIKNNYVCILLNNKLLPFNAWSVMASAPNWTIKEGEEFEVELSNTAWNAEQPNEWFLVKDGGAELTQGNILDTLYQEQWGEVTFKTKEYKKGKNSLIFVSRLNTPPKDRTIYKRVTFTVE